MVTLLRYEAFSEEADAHSLRAHCAVIRSSTVVSKSKYGKQGGALLERCFRCFCQLIGRNTFTAKLISGEKGSYQRFLFIQVAVLCLTFDFGIWIFKKVIFRKIKTLILLLTIVHSMTATQVC